MREAVEDLIKRYKKRFDNLNDLMREAISSGNDVRVARIQARQATYSDVIIELQLLLDDEHETDLVQI